MGASMSSEASLLKSLAEHPEDRALRLVFADWLLERGDPRGEVIALCERGNLSLTEKRKVARLTEQHGARWLGPLREVADLQRTRFDSGFVSELHVSPHAPPGALEELAGTPELATVRTFVVPPVPRVTPLTRFLDAPVLRRLERLELGPLDWQALAGFTGGPAQLLAVGIAGFGAFDGELAPMTKVELFSRARRLELLTTEFVNPLVVADVRQALLAESRVLSPFEEVRLVARYAVFEGAVAWLLGGDEFGRLESVWPRARYWSVEYAEVIFRLAREPGAAFERLLIDCSAHDMTGGLDKRINAAAGVLVQLAPARLSDVEVRLPHGARLRKGERDALRAALRRSGTVRRFTLGDEKFLP
jgi:uncharacterized protein (TIGR02996 family)